MPWLLSLGIFDKEYASATAGSSHEHTYAAPDLFNAETPLGTYQGVTGQVVMSRTRQEQTLPERLVNNTVGHLLNGAAEPVVQRDFEYCATSTRTSAIASKMASAPDRYESPT